MPVFKSKYIFETKQTKFIRNLKNVLVLLLILVISYGILGMAMMKVAENEENISAKTLLNNPPQLIVVFTGDAGRIQRALEIAHKFNHDHIFITGVYSKNTIEGLLKVFEASQTVDANRFEIDYIASNTLENSISTFQYLRKNKNIKSVLIISNDYHIMRIKLIINSIKRPTDENHFYYHCVKTNFNTVRNWKIMAKEIYKLIRTYAFLALWKVE